MQVEQMQNHLFLALELERRWRRGFLFLSVHSIHMQLGDWREI
jgi:hypothetical protein